ncbi:hypothetical protein LUZ61_013321 [Rhynchospora tenuis]|uniref:BTB domain-containing protein n=1 Tax=Rhynchospora tenuis TaxID=198213 RepID=A0AAD5Z1M3_9POAL|nr:hypothetical protein LUZ61_013321 [Rhynchospora tenuis]
MDCCICSPLASLYRPPRNTICHSCYEGAKCIVSFFSESSSDREVGASAKIHCSKPMSSKGIADAFKRLKEMKEKEIEINEKLGFLEGFGAALHEELHTDIFIKPGNGPPIPAHRAILAARSQVFKNILSSDECKAPVEEEISLPELTHDELKSLLHFLYHGYVSEEASEKHYYSLLVAADKYDIPYLRKYCERHILRSLEPSNALDVLEVSDACQNMLLKEQAMDIVVKNAESVVFSTNYNDFALKNAHLCVEITRELLVRTKDSKIEAL